MGENGISVPSVESSPDRPEEVYDPSEDRMVLQKVKRRMIEVAEDGRPDLIIEAIKLWGLQACIEVAQSMYVQARNPKSSSRVKEAFLKIFWIPMMQQPSMEQEMALRALQAAQQGTLQEVLARLADQIEDAGKRREARAEPVSEAEFEEVMTGLRARLLTSPRSMLSQVPESEQEGKDGR